MNKTKKGDNFELEIFQFLERELTEGRLALRPDCSKIFQKKGYFSKDRDSDIIFDISIEVYAPNTESISELWLIECKNYASSIPVDDAEEFFAKMEQVSAKKGVIFSRNSFQEGAINFCKSKRIGLVRYFDKENFKWELYRSSHVDIFSYINREEKEYILSGLMNESYHSNYFNFYCCDNNTFTNSLSLFFGSLSSKQDNLSNKIRDRVYSANAVPRISRSQIEKLSKQVLADVGFSESPVSVMEICRQKHIRLESVISKEMAPTAHKTKHTKLGRIKFAPLEITVFDHLDGNHTRQRFTVAHELGHYFLGHSKFMSGEYCEDRDFEFENVLKVSVSDIRRMEWQANQFASCLLLPKDALIMDFSELLQKREIKNRGFGALYVDDQRCNMVNYYAVVNSLRFKYNVSVSVVKFRLEGLGLLNDCRSKPNRLRSILTLAKLFAN